ncbi:hypothetical protein [Maricaulis sp.]|uniref:hypothetical protein n=1 Tax=Maricaulis sp. TaxID=1486257 RepID=UPI001B0EFF1B|nr:hypothetical protein [Maricaulis sp.]MBO6765414.1 hypothetical protein [Maricaulis sp.]
MAIDYAGHCRLPVAEARMRIAEARQAHPDWFDFPFRLTDPRALQNFDAEIAREFGIEAKSRFTLFVQDKEKLDGLEDALDYLYALFGPDNLVLTWGLDTIRPPRG